MADAATNGTAGQDAAARKKFPKTLAIIAGIAMLQGLGFFVVFKMFSAGPAAAHGEDNPALSPTSQPVTCTEVQLLKNFKVPNDKAGALRIYDMDLSIVVPESRQKDAEYMAEARQGEIADSVARILRGATDHMLREDDLRVLRKQFEDALDEVVGDETLIVRVLIPKFVPIRAE